MNVIEFSNVTKNIYNFKLKPTNFILKEKEILGIIGKNGSGKSTIYKLLLNFYHPKKGSISIFELDSSKDNKEIKKNIGCVPQSNWFNDNMRPISLLKETIRSRRKKTYSEIDFLLEYFDIKLARKIGDMSFLDKRKLAIINGLVTNPDLIIVDEPDNIPDVKTRMKLYDILEEKNREGASVLIFGTNLKEAQSICHNIIYLSDGEMIEEEDQRNKLSNDKILKYYDANIPREIFTGIGAKLVKSGEETVFYFNGSLNLLAEAIYKAGLIDYTVEDSCLDEKLAIIEKEKVLPSSIDKTGSKNFKTKEHREEVIVTNNKNISEEIEASGDLINQDTVVITDSELIKLNQNIEKDKEVNQ